MEYTKDGVNINRRDFSKLLGLGSGLIFLDGMFNLLSAETDASENHPKEKILYDSFGEIVDYIEQAIDRLEYTPAQSKHSAEYPKPKYAKRWIASAERRYRAIAPLITEVNNSQDIQFSLKTTINRLPDEEEHRVEEDTYKDERNALSFALIQARDLQNTYASILYSEVQPEKNKGYLELSLGFVGALIAIAIHKSGEKEK